MNGAILNMSLIPSVAIAICFVLVANAADPAMECDSGTSDLKDHHVSLLQNGLSINKLTPSALSHGNDVTMWDPPLPISAVVPAGQCVFTEDYVSAPLLSKIRISNNTRIFTFGLPDPDKPLGLTTCAAVKLRLNGVAKFYTPVSTNAMLGQFQLMIKIYPDGQLTPLIDALQVGESAEFEHHKVNILYPFNKRAIGMIAGGTGIAPMLQALNAVLGTPPDKTKVSLLYANKQLGDILAKTTLDSWSEAYPDQLNVTYALSQEPKSSSWPGIRGHFNATHLKAYLPPPSSDCIIFVCGPPSYTDALGFDDTYVKMLGEMGYKPEQIYEF